MNPRINVGRGVTGAVRYVLGQGRDPKTGEVKELTADEQSRVAWISGQGAFGFDIETAADAERARRVMEFDALNQNSRTRRCEKDCVHLSLAWSPKDAPTRQQMEEAARDALKALGMENAKAIFVAHNDEEYSHVHIVASKINPATGRAYDLERSQNKLSDWALNYEREHGGVISLRRQDASELRSAIRDRDAGAVLEAMTKQRSTFTPTQLHRALEKEIIRPGRHGEDRAADERLLARFESTVLAHSELVRLSNTPDGEITRYTTRTVLEAELHVLRAAQGLASSTGHAISDRERARVLAGEQFAKITREQSRAFRHATSAKGLAIIDGQAGTGKSFTIAAIRQAYEKAGYRVIGLGPTNAVAEDMRGDGFAQAGTVHSELFKLNNDRTSWNRRTVVVVDEAAMLDTKLMAMVTAHANEAGTKLILVGDDRQLSSIDRGGMFGALKDRHGAAELSEVKRQHKNDERRASEMMAAGDFHDALGIYQQKGAIQWTRTQGEARAALIEQWAKDSAAAPDKTRFVFAYTNDDVDRLNAELRAVRRERGELGEDRMLDTAHGRAAFAAGDRIQFTGTDKKAGIQNGRAGRIEAIEGTSVTVKLDGRQGMILTFDAAAFAHFRHGYAGTIYRGQGRTLDQTYLYHSEHWRSAASYVALTRHRDKTALFVARNTAADLKQLARQMGRVDDRRAASMFHSRDRIGPVRPLTARQILEKFAGAWARRGEQRHDFHPHRPEIVPDDRRQKSRLAGSTARRMRGDDLTHDTGRRQQEWQQRANKARVDRGAHVDDGVFRSIAQLFSSFINSLADSIAPAPRLTEQQAELRARSNAERQEQQATDQAEHDKRAQEDWLIAEMRRSQEMEAARDPRLAAMMNLHTQPSSARQQETDRERDRD
jgi:Ti-type conjugative transfer relaxase TraA